MTINPLLTDQYVAQMRDSNLHRDCSGTCPFAEAANDYATQLGVELPGLDPAVIGEVALHIGAKAAEYHHRLQRAGHDKAAAGMGALNLIADIGMTLYHGTPETKGPSS